MTKYLILLAVSVAAFATIRVQTNNIAKVMYVEGCNDSSLLLAHINKPISAVEVAAFCRYRKKVLDEYAGPFE